MPKPQLAPVIMAPAPVIASLAEPAAIEPKDESPPRIETEPVAPALAASPVAAAVVARPVPWTLGEMLAVVWLLGVLSVFGVMMFLHLRMTARLRRDRQAPSEEALSVLRKCCAAARVSPVPTLIMTDAVTAPALFGVLRPAILMPSDLVADAASLRLILLHELAHLKRRDLWVQVVTSLVVTLHWFNPLAWWAHRRLRAEAEMAADAHVLRLTEKAEAHRFGEVLLGFASRAAAGWALWFAAATVLGIAEGRHDLRRRIDAIVDYSRGRRAWWIVGLTAFVMLAVTGLTQAPAEEVKSALPPGSTVTGIVVDDAGRPIHGATAFLSIGEINSREVRKFTTDEEGRFRFVGVPEKTDLVAWARHDEFMDIKLPNPKFTTEDKSERRIVLARVKRWLSGTVTRKADGSPVKDATVYADRAYGNLPEHRILQFSRRQVKTDERGHYRLAAWDDETTEISIAVEAPNTQIQPGRLTWKDAEQTQDFSLEPDAMIAGRVVDDQGKPLAGAKVCVGQRMFSFIFMKNVRRADNGYQGLGDFYWMGEPETNAKGEFSGRLIAPSPEEETDWLVVMHPEVGFKRVKVKDWKNGDALKLDRWRTLEGQALDEDAQPLKSAAIRLMQMDRDEYVIGGPRGFSLLDSQELRSDEQGRYRIERILPNAEDLTVTVNKRTIWLRDLTFTSGETKHYDLRFPAPKVVTPKDQLRGVTGRVRAPEGYSLKSENFTVEVRLNHEGSGMSETATVDEQGRFTTKPVEPGNWQVRIWLKPKDPKLTYGENPGVAMRVLIETTAKKVESKDAKDSRTPLELQPQTPLDVGELTLAPADFEFRSASDAAKRNILLPVKVKMNSPVSGAAAFATWTGGDGRTLAPEQSFTRDGRIQGTITTASDHQFIVRALKPDGSRWFSGALSAPEDEATEFSSELTLNASVDVEGKVHGLADNYEGDGWIVAAVTVPNAEKIGTVIQGSARTTGWYAWAPVSKDGQFRFKGLPRGRLAISGYGKSWCTSSLDGYGTQSQINLMKAGPVTKLNLDIRPTRQQQVKVLRPDGTPAAGATISVETNGTSTVQTVRVRRLVSSSSDRPQTTTSTGNTVVNQALVVRDHIVEPEFKEAYERYKKYTFPKHRATTNKEGLATLGELSGESCYVRVNWLDADGKTTHNESVRLSLTSRPEPLVELKLARKIR
jgi:beta-lactamase regulating signal transducer with metallopeptidase domain/protocatechuate 3,4-dioxygenase beta subunit